MRNPAPIDWLGNVTFAVGLILVMIAITYGIQPYGGHVMGWTSPRVLTELGAGFALLCTFVVVERRVPYPMFRLELLRIRAFTFGTLSSFLSALARGGLMFMLIIWLQGIWLPRHGYSFAATPLWAGIYMLPLSIGVVLAGPISGILSDRFGSRPFATAGMIMQATAFVLLQLLPTDFSYPAFASHPPAQRAGLRRLRVAQPGRRHEQPAAGAPWRRQRHEHHLPEQRPGAVHRGVLHPHDRRPVPVLPQALGRGLLAEGVRPAVVAQVVHLPPVSVLFAAFLGYNPLQHLLGNSVLASLPHSAVAKLTSEAYFPSLISAAFRSGCTRPSPSPSSAAASRLSPRGRGARGTCTGSPTWA